MSKVNAVNQNDDNERESDAPLSLSELRDTITNQTFQWLKDAELTETVAEDEEEATSSPFLFGPAGDNEDEQEKRVQTWCSSNDNPDGVGGYYIATDEDDDSGNEGEEKSTTDDENCLHVQYIVSANSGGHGAEIWAASRHVANQLANSEHCRELLSPLLQLQHGSTLVEKRQPSQHHPLQGKSFVELGAGAGIPSWTAMWCGANVVCTDQAIPDRIRCLAESAERNRRAMKRQAGQNATPTVARACPYNWGESTEEVTGALRSDNEKFDVVVAADCVYMPDCHKVLLNSIGLLMSDAGVAILPFALHGNTKDENVWGILDLAKNHGFHVEDLGAQQLTPQSFCMESKRALVHMLRLTKAKSR